MSKSQHKRICVQSGCAVRKELDNLLNEKDKTIQLLANALKKCAITLEEVDGSDNDTEELIELADKYLGKKKPVRD